MKKRQYVFALVALSVAGGGVRAQSTADSFEEKLRKAAETQVQRNARDDDDAKRLAALFAAQRAALEQQQLTERRADEAAFRQRVAASRIEDAARQAKLEDKIASNEAKLGGAIKDATDRLVAVEAESAKRFREQSEQFHEELKARIAAELAKAEKERERKKELAMMAAMTYFTGGAALPMMAGSGAGGVLGKSGGGTAPPVATRRVPSNLTPSVGKRVYAVPIGPQPLPATANNGINERWMGKFGGYLGSAVGGYAAGKTGKGAGAQIGSGVAGGVGGDIGTELGQALGRQVDRHADELKKTYDPKSDLRFDPRSLFGD